MITLIEALNYRCLRDVQVRLRPFHVLVGPNASGKSTLMDVVEFLGDVVGDGLDEALHKRAPDDPRELLSHRQGDRMEFGLEAEIPQDLREKTIRPDLDSIRYEIAIGLEESGYRFEFKAERLVLKKRSKPDRSQNEFFPRSMLPRQSLLSNTRKRDNKLIINKVPGGNDNFYSECLPRVTRWAPSFKLGARKSALGNLVPDEGNFPVSTWFLRLLASGVQRLSLNSLAIKKPSPPVKAPQFLADGSNLPWAVDRLQKRDPKRFAGWLENLQTVLPDLKAIKTVIRDEDRHCYLVFEYENGASVPSWLVSDGTLRLAALTLPAWLGEHRGIYLIEEPENGIHPKAIPAVNDPLSSVYDAQVLMATHSPVILNANKLDDILCFARNERGSTDIVAGNEHPNLRQWTEVVDLGTLLAAGVMG
ncbi:methylation-associated defense system AAA family ATPase MAD3 [Thioalkalivibrio sp. HK1]|uniref:methylation-associated defense system AAA family ATPase MAD3 n=1 Tax=Thioalkalivibrio sp. HK1 TaxID=1469245 RepID=UPI000471FE41|nr:ATP-binding protein [Thioalkalivibrio sp. HK1]